MADQLDAQIRALVLEVVDSGPVPPTFEDIEAGLERDNSVGGGQRRRRRVAVAVVLAAALTLAGAVVLGGGSRGASHSRISAAATTNKAAKAKDACALITTAELLFAAQGRTTPRIGYVNPPYDPNKSTSYCEWGPFEAVGADGSTGFWVNFDETVGPKAAAEYKNARRMLSTGTTRLSGLPTGFVGVTGSPKKGSDALAPLNYVAYSKTSKKLLIFGVFPMSSSALDLHVAADPVLPAEQRYRELVRAVRRSAEVHNMINSFIVLALSRI